MRPGQAGNLLQVDAPSPDAYSDFVEPVADAGI